MHESCWIWVEQINLLILISRWPGMYLLLKWPVENPSQLHHFRTNTTGKHPKDYSNWSCKTDCRSRSRNTKALTEISMKMLLGTLFLYLCWTALKHTETCSLKPQLWKHPKPAPKICPHHFIQEVLVPSSHKNPSKLKHSGTSQTVIHIPKKHLGSLSLNRYHSSTRSLQGILTMTTLPWKMMTAG